MADRATLHRIQDSKEFRVDSRLAARDLDQIGLALARHQRIEHRLDLAERKMRTVDIGGIGEADRAGEVARLVDLDQRQAAVLFVIGTQPAIERTACLGAGLHLQRAVARLEPQRLLLPIGQIVADQGFLHAMRAATLEIIDAAILADHLGRDRFEADLAQAGGLPVKDIRRGLARHDFRRGLVNFRQRVATR